MKKIVRRFKTKAEANKYKEKVLKMGYSAVTYQRCSKYACMVSSTEDFPEQIYNSLLGGQINHAEHER